MWPTIILIILLLLLVRLQPRNLENSSLLLPFPVTCCLGSYLSLTALHTAHHLRFVTASVALDSPFFFWACFTPAKRASSHRNPCCRSPAVSPVPVYKRVIKETCTRQLGESSNSFFFTMNDCKIPSLAIFLMHHLPPSSSILVEHCCQRRPA